MGRFEGMERQPQLRWISGGVQGAAEDAWRKEARSELSAGQLVHAGVPSVDRSDRLARAAALMHSKRVAALAVVDGERLAGMVTERDVLRAVADGLSSDTLCVAEYMTPVEDTIGAADQATVAARRMIEHGVRHLPVFSGERVVGVISASDVLVGWGVPQELIGP